MAKSTLDKDLGKVVKLEAATYDVNRALVAPGLAAVFILAALVWAVFSIADGPFAVLVIIAAVISAYMALNVGANDVANNMGPAVGGKALTMLSALVIAAIFEAAGALIAGGDVVKTVSRDLLTPGAAIEARDFILVMMAASLASAMWIHLATYLNAPVSTTHSVVGGVVGAGIAAFGVSVVSWGTIGKIVMSWIISPALGGLLAALLLYIATQTIYHKQDKITAARFWVPMFVALMAGVFAMYLVTKGLSHVWKPDLFTVLAFGLGGGFLGWLVASPWIKARVVHIENRPKHINALFRLPLIFAAALLSFAHGANDVANAVGPLAAIVASAETGLAAPDKVPLPLWVLAIGAVGIAVGLALFGPRLIRTVGEKITKMNEVRAYCVALSAAITVLVASALGLPVSSTHIAVGAVFGVGFLREFRTNTGIRKQAAKANGPNPPVNQTAEAAIANMVRRERRRLVRRQHMFSIAAAWVITVPAAALVSALLYVAMRWLVSFG